MISKELLSEVLKNETKGLKSFGLSACAKYIIFQYEDFDDSINIYELAFRTREYLKTKSKHLSLNQSIDDIFKEANDIYELQSLRMDTKPN